MRIRISLAILAVIAVFAAFGPLVSGYAYYQTNLELKNLPPSSQFWFGTDDLGRDLFTRVWMGARISLFVGTAAGLIDLGLGILWGATAAFCGGKVDEAMMRALDVLCALPQLLLVTLLMVVWGTGLFTIILALAICSWGSMARIVRSRLIQIKNEEYVLASRALGAPFLWILRKHLIPNAYGAILAALTLTIPAAIFIEAFLSFLGLGVEAPMASWGTMVHEGVPALGFFPWRLFFPAGFLCATLFAFTLLGEALRERYA